MKEQLVDRKNILTYLFWSWVNETVLSRRFKQIKVTGGDQLPPKQQPFMVVSNHISRWDGLLIYNLLRRPANFMVSPNELFGLQGRVLLTMGAFPASARFDLKNHVRQQIAKGEPLVIFPEGDIHKDGTTHAFKSGAARFALALAEGGVDLPILPIAITYGADGQSAEIAIAQPVSVRDYVGESTAGTACGARWLTERLWREVCHLRCQLGSQLEKQSLFMSKSKWNAPASA